MSLQMSYRKQHLETDYNKGLVNILSEDEYIDILKSCAAVIPDDVVIHRLTGDGAKRDLIAPLWSANKKDVLNSLHRMMLEKDTTQGRRFNSPN